MINRPWPKETTPVAPAPECINAGYGIYDPDAGRYRRRRISPLLFSCILAAAFLFFTFGLRPAVGVFVGIAEMIGGQ